MMHFNDRSVSTGTFQCNESVQIHVPKIPITSKNANGLLKMSGVYISQLKMLDQERAERHVTRARNPISSSGQLVLLHITHV